MTKSELTDIACEIKIETKAAWLINDGTREVWVPKSQVEMEQHSRGAVCTMPYWLAHEKGLI